MMARLITTRLQRQVIYLKMSVPLRVPGEAGTSPEVVIRVMAKKHWKFVQKSIWQATSPDSLAPWPLKLRMHRRPRTILSASNEVGALSAPQHSARAGARNI